MSIQKDLKQYASQKRKKTNEWFFKTRKGEYGEHDRFLGIANPDVRRVAKKYYDCSFVKLQKLFMSQYNEERLCALVILVERYRHKKTTQKEKKEIYNFYIKNLDYINNWNLVDLSAPHIVGEYLVNCVSERKILDKLVVSGVQWHRRVCILATWAFIKRNNFVLVIKYAEKLLQDEEDLMHKSVGWMLREVWKRDNQICEKFLCDYYDRLPRTTLRYAIERMPNKKRKKFLTGKF